MKYIKKYNCNINESNVYDTLNERIKKNYKNNKEILGLVGFYDAYELGYIINENFDNVELSPLTPSFTLDNKVVKNSEYIIYNVHTLNNDEIQDKEAEFKQNFIEKCLNRLVELSKGNKFYVQNLYIFKSFGDGDGFRFDYGVKLIGYFPQ